MNITRQTVLGFLEEISDPEIPVINIVELGVVRDIVVQPSQQVEIIITPTYSGCPAMQAIQELIQTKMQEKGVQDFSLRTILSPSWTTDWMSEEAKRKLKEYGIAPPGKVDTGSPLPFSDTPRNIMCPFCDSYATQKKSEFGSTPCKSLYYCNSCQQPFEHFKCH